MTRSQDREPIERGKPPKPGRRLPYRAPRLLPYGNVADLTRGGVIGDVADHGANMMSPSIL